MDVEGLRRIAVLSDLSDEDLRSVGTWAVERSVPAGETLVREGDFAYDLFVIQEGTADVTRSGEHLADLGPGDVFGEIGVLTDEQRNATVTATSNMRLLVLNHWDLDKLRKQIPQLDERVQQAMRERMSA